MHVHELGYFRPLLMSKAFGFELELPIIKKKKKNKCIIGHIMEIAWVLPLVFFHYDNFMI